MKRGAIKSLRGVWDAEGKRDRGVKRGAIKSMRGVWDAEGTRDGGRAVAKV